MKNHTLLSLMIAVSTLITGTDLLARTAIQNKGSDTLVNVAQAWAEAYQNVEPNVVIAVSGGGSGTGIAAMINGTVDIANASRKMKKREIEMAKGRGQAPMVHIVGYDALAVFLNQNNPIKTLTIAQLNDIYNRKGTARKWSDLRVSVPGCKSDQIVVVSRQNNSGTYAYFKKAVLGKKGKYRSGTLDMHGSKDVVDLVEKTPCAIGYSGLAYATDHINMACISKDGKTCVNPSVATASDGRYPIARPLFMYTNGEPMGEIKTYMEYVKSNVGQCTILDKGYASIRDVSCN